MMKNLIQSLAQIQNLAAAFARVQANAGCRGSDGVSVPHFAANLESNLRDLSNSLAKQEYQPYPLLRFPIPKNSKEQAEKQTAKSKQQKAKSKQQSKACLLLLALCLLLPNASSPFPP